MAGIFGAEINNRADFFRELARAKGVLAQVLTRRGADPTLQSVARQLDAIEQWTANGRTPTLEEAGVHPIDWRLDAG